jgi:hypothetical protein
MVGVEIGTRIVGCVEVILEMHGTGTVGVSDIGSGTLTGCVGLCKMVLEVGLKLLVEWYRKWDCFL